jgi:hypothetical protein
MISFPYIQLPPGADAPLAPAGGLRGASRTDEEERLLDEIWGPRR